MVGPWPHRAFTFRALSKTYGQMWLRCDVCRRYARLNLAGLHDVDYRTKTFSCSRCGGEAYFCLVEPITEYGMADYRVDEVEKPERHPDAVRRLTEPPRRSISSRGGEQPGRKIDGRRWDFWSGKVRLPQELLGADTRHARKAANVRWPLDLQRKTPEVQRR